MTGADLSARDEILARLRGRRRPATVPPPWRSRRRFDDLVARFAAALEQVKGEAHVAADLDEALAVCDGLLAALGARRIVVNHEAPWTAVDLPGRWPAYTWHRVGQDAGDLRQFCAAADVGLTGATAALAETGTIVVGSGPGRSRLVPLLPPVHLALVPLRHLLPDLFTWTAARSAAPRSNILLISGPSKTADIEQTLAVGVHGPKRFIVVLYGD